MRTISDPEFRPEFSHEFICLTAALEENRLCPARAVGKLITTSKNHCSSLPSGSLLHHCKTPVTCLKFRLDPIVDTEYGIVIIVREAQIVKRYRIQLLNPDGNPVGPILQRFRTRSQPNLSEMQSKS